MKLPRRKFLHFAAGAAALPVGSRIARAQAYPSRPVRLIEGFGAGGGPDIVARLIGQWLSEQFRQPYLVENRPGANGNIATEAVVRAAPDGHTLLLATTANVITTALYEKLNFNFVRDITPVASIMRVPLVMVVNPSFPARTVSEFIAYAKANPGKINVGGPGSRTLVQLCVELFKMMAGINVTYVPYRGDAPGLTDLLGGQIEMYFGGTLSAVGYIKAGRLHPLAVTTTARLEVLPDTPALGEFLSGYEASAWFGVGAPKNAPAEIVDKLNKEINAALADSKMKTRLADLGGTVLPGSPGNFGKLIADETEKWGKVIRAANIKLE
jgi:tripartite-type tricarboxylate transporter receptor subunit TctC